MARGDIRMACLEKRRHKIHIIEVGYGSDTLWKDTLERKRQQHQQLKEELTTAGWPVEEHIIVLGHAGTTYNTTLTALQKLGVEKQQALALMTTLHIHSVHMLWTIVRTRRHLERSVFVRNRTNPPPRLGIG